MIHDGSSSEDERFVEARNSEDSRAYAGVKVKTKKLYVNTTAQAGADRKSLC